MASLEVCGAVAYLSSPHSPMGSHACSVQVLLSNSVPTKRNQRTFLSAWKDNTGPCGTSETGTVCEHQECIIAPQQVTKLSYERLVCRMLRVWHSLHQPKWGGEGEGELSQVIEN